MMKFLMSMMTGGVSCSQIDEGLDEFIDGEMSFLKRMRFRMHFAVCKACSAYMKAYRSTVDLVKSSFDSTPAEEPIDEAMINSILEAQNRADGKG